MSPPRLPTLADAVAEGRKELRYRARVFPRLIEQGSMKQAEADFRNAALELLITTAEEKIAADPGAAGRLF